MRFSNYGTDGFFDEMFDGDSRPSASAKALVQFIDTLPEGELLRRQRSAERALLHMGITFNVYGDSAGTTHFSIRSRAAHRGRGRVADDRKRA